MKGRRPLPTNWKVLRGNPGKRPLNKNEPKPAIPNEPPAAPPFLSGYALEEWRRISVEAYRLGNWLQGRLKSRFAELEAAHREEVAALKLTVTELRCELREMRAIQESARIASRGEAGPMGPRGIPGPPGPAGARGEKGCRIEAGGISCSIFRAMRRRSFRATARHPRDWP